MAPEKNCKKLG